MPNSVDQECRGCPEKPAGNSPCAIGQGFDETDAAFLINPEGAAHFDVCPLKPLANNPGYWRRGFHGHPFKIRRAQNWQN